MSHLQQGPGIGVPLNLRRGPYCIPCPSRSIYEHLTPFRSHRTSSQAPWIPFHPNPCPEICISTLSKWVVSHLHPGPDTRVWPPSRLLYKVCHAIQVMYYLYRSPEIGISTSIRSNLTSIKVPIFASYLNLGPYMSVSPPRSHRTSTQAMTFCSYHNPCPEICISTPSG